VIRAVLFDLDGVLLDSEQVWDEVRRAVVAEQGGRWRDDATEAMHGMSSPEWSRYLRQVLGVPLDEEEINDLVVAGMLERYRQALPLLPGAHDVVERIGRRWPLGLASSSNRVVIDEVLAASGWQDAFAVTLSSEEVGHGKPTPDVYREAARRLGFAAERCAAVEDSATGTRSALAARCPVVVVPNAHYPPPAGLLSQVDLVVAHLDEITVGAIASLRAEQHAHVEERIDEAELESFPASDPHADWAGPPH
jgi:HAD superfamily hydrolase (TIGR01509 family)